MNVTSNLVFMTCPVEEENDDEEKQSDDAVGNQFVGVVPQFVHHVTSCDGIWSRGSLR